MNDERKEKAPPRVDDAILGDRRRQASASVYHVHDAEGRVVFESHELIDVVLFRGSRMEH